MEDALILALVGKGAVDPSLVRRVQERGIDWAYVLEAAHRHAIAPFLLERVLAMDLSPAERSLLERECRESVVQTLHDNLVFRSELSRLVGALAARGIECVLFKGLSLDHSMLRPTGDIDLLIEKTRLLDAIECVLTVPGYEYVEESGNGTSRRCYAALTHRLRNRIASQASWKHEYQAYNSRRGVLVELHVALFSRPKPGDMALDTAPSERVVQRIRERSCLSAELACKTPRPEHSLLVMCLHISLKRSPANNRFRLGALVDIASLAEGGVPWDSFVRECVEVQLASHALFSLSLARRLVDAPVPWHVLTDLRESCSDVQRFLVRLHLRCVRSLEASSWLYRTLYHAVLPWSIPGAWGDRVVWMLGLPLWLPSRYRMALQFNGSGGSLLHLIGWLLNPIRWTLEMTARRR